MKTLFLDEFFKYSGKELCSHFIYEHGIKGSGILSWIGPCEVQIDSMLDMEDRLNGDCIFSESMVHFIGEFFHRDIFYGIFVQRLLGEHSKSIISDMCDKDMYDKDMCDKKLKRRGDDLYLDDKKLNVSIATVSPLSSLVHFAVNVSSKNTPVSTVGLEDLGIDPYLFSNKVLKALEEELNSVDKASCKVKTI